MSILDLFMRRGRNENDEQDGYEGQDEIKAERETRQAAETSKRKPVDKLLEDLWANREQYPDDMQAVEYFLPALRDRLEINETKRGAAEMFANAEQGGL